MTPWIVACKVPLSMGFVRQEYWSGLPFPTLKGTMNSLMDSVGEGEGGMIWENGIETCIISYKKRIASPGSMQDIGCSGLVYWDDPEG